MDNNNDEKYEQIAQLEEDLVRMEEQREMHYNQMGRSVMELADQEKQDTNELTEEIIRKKKKLVELRNEK